MKTVSTEIIINAPVKRIWNILSDFAQYAIWNPFIIYVKGDFKEGEKLSVIQKPPGEKPRLFKRRISKIIAPKEMQWHGKLIIPGLFDARHIFSIEPINDKQCRFVHKIHYSGLLTSLLWNRIEWSLKAGFNKMNQALKDMAEKNAQGTDAND